MHDFHAVVRFVFGAVQHATAITEERSEALGEVYPPCFELRQMGNERCGGHSFSGGDRSNRRDQVVIGERPWRQRHEQLISLALDTMGPASSIEFGEVVKQIRSGTNSRR